MRDFAQELVDFVIDNVAAASNTRDVRSCGSVCRRWLLRSRIHLFSHIYLSSSYPDYIQVLMDLIDASSSDILSLVQTLHICVTCGISDPHMARLQSCARLRELRIHGLYQVDWHEFERLVLIHVPRFGASCPSLTRFEFVPPGDLPLHVLAGIVSGLPSLTHLRLSAPVFAGIVHPATIPAESSFSYPKTVPPLDTLPPNWHALDISLQGANLLFQWLLSHREPPIFTSLRLVGWVVRREQIEPIRSYFHRFGSRIESLSLAYSVGGLNAFNDIETSAFEAHVMASTSRLVELNLNGHHPEAIPAIFSSISSAQLTTLTIEVLRGRQPDWLLIDTALATPKFGSLQNISFTQYPGSLLTPEVKAMMPQASARNILL